MSSEGATLEQRAGAKSALREAIFVTVAGIVLAFVANAISPVGLTLSRDYFLTSSGAMTNVPAATSPLTTTNSLESAPVLTPIPRLTEKGLQGIARDQALKFFHDSQRLPERVVFVDARNEDSYTQGHIPGAYELDYYQPEKYLPAVLPVCQSAGTVVVYCTGIDCDDSELTAILLRDSGIPNQKLFVYAGGITEWTSNSLPVEIGARKSGNVKNPEK